MKIPNKQELRQVEINHSLDIDFKEFFNLILTWQRIQCEDEIIIYFLDVIKKKNCKKKS